jgi:predicted nuclease with TOPRIM domain
VGGVCITRGTLDTRVRGAESRGVSADPFERLREELREGFHGVHQRLDGLEAGQVRLEAGQAKLEGRQARLEGRQARLEDRQAQLETGQAQLGVELRETEDRLRTHFGVLVEAMQSKLDLVIEGVLMVDQKVDRLHRESQGEIGKLQRQTMALAARIPRRHAR